MHGTIPSPGPEHGRHGCYRNSHRLAIGPNFAPTAVRMGGIWGGGICSAEDHITHGTAWRSAHNNENRHHQQRRYPRFGEGGAGAHAPSVQRFRLETYRKLFRYAEMKGVTALSVRRTVVARLYERGADEDDVGLILGISERSAVRELLARHKPTIEQLLDELV